MEATTHGAERISPADPHQHTNKSLLASGRCSEGFALLTGMNVLFFQYSTSLAQTLLLRAWQGLTGHRRRSLRLSVTGPRTPQTIYAANIASIHPTIPPPNVKVAYITRKCQAPSFQAGK
eukprot:784806-Pyramimonas_sp.AAC.2